MKIYVVSVYHLLKGTYLPIALFQSKKKAQEFINLQHSEEHLMEEWDTED